MRRIRSLSDAAEDASNRERKRQWHWCRRPNGFSDMPRWRVVAERLELPLFQVLAVANRLEELGNDAANKGFGRGEVTHFDAAEFGAALGMPAAAAQRIYTVFEDVGWVVDGHIADFWDRNKDEEDETAALRQRRKRARASVLRQLARLGRLGLVDPLRRRDIELRLPSLATMADAELFVLAASVEQALSPAQTITRDAHRDSVTVTPEKTTYFNTAAVDNSGGGARGNATGLAEQKDSPQPELSTAAAELWLADDAVRILVAKHETRPRAELLIARWRRDLEDDAIAAMTLIAGLADPRLSMARCQALAGEHIKHCRDARLKGEKLPLPPVRNFGTDPLKRTADGHGVMASPVDKTAAPEANPAARRSGTDG